jgi:hypothetical protein
VRSTYTSVAERGDRRKVTAEHGGWGDTQLLDRDAPRRRQ